MKSKSGSGIASVVSVIIIALSAPPSMAEPAEGLCSKTFSSPIDSGVNLTARPKIEYPPGEGVWMGEGWVDLRFTIGADGIPRNHQVQDALGSEIYAPYAIRGMAQARYEIPKSRGLPVPWNISSSPVDFHIEGTNRAGEHERYQNDYDRAFKLRHEQKYQEAIDIMEETIRHPLSLYALTSAAFELSRSYQEMGKLDEALYHSRHATIDGATFIDKGLTREALARRIELEAQTHNYWEAVCAYEQFREDYADSDLEPKFQQWAAQSRDQLLGKAPIETDVRLIDRKRKDVESFWSHRLIRTRIEVRVTSGQIDHAQAVCPIQVIDLPVGPTVSFQANESLGTCNFYIFAAPGTTLHVTESS